jgi:hypothetical protein
MLIYKYNLKNESAMLLSMTTIIKNNG